MWILGQLWKFHASSLIYLTRSNPESAKDFFEKASAQFDDPSQIKKNKETIISTNEACENMGITSMDPNLERDEDLEKQINKHLKVLFIFNKIQQSNL